MGQVKQVIPIILVALAACSTSSPNQCVAGARICSDNTVLLCSPATLSFEIEQLCTPGQTCSGGQCIQDGPPDYRLGSDAKQATDADSVPLISDVSESDSTTPSADVAQTTDIASPIDTGNSGDTAQSADSNPPPETSQTVDTANAVDASPPVETASPTDTGIDAPPGALSYHLIPNFKILNDIHRVKWHPSGDFAVLIGAGGVIATYTESTGQVAEAMTINATFTDLDVAHTGAYFVVTGYDKSKASHIWQLLVKADHSLSLGVSTPLNNGIVRAAAVQPGSTDVALASSAGNNVNFLMLWTIDDGIKKLKGYNSCGVSDVMWAKPSLYGTIFVRFSMFCTPSDALGSVHFPALGSPTCPVDL